MSTKTEPYRKYVAHDEKSKFFIFLSVIAHGKPRNVAKLGNASKYDRSKPEKKQAHLCKHLTRATNL